VRPPLLLAIILLGTPAAAAERVTVAVLYFDNNSPDREYDVLQKGLADMLVTDLSQVDSLQVVERDKLQKLVDELKLQRSKFFDPSTAQQLGKGIGARYAVTGALAAIEPRMRIDVRVIEVARRG
jgi:TolB-like protein